MHTCVQGLHSVSQNSQKLLTETQRLHLLVSSVLFDTFHQALETSVYLKYIGFPAPPLHLFWTSVPQCINSAFTRLGIISFWDETAAKKLSSCFVFSLSSINIFQSFPHRGCTTHFLVLPLGLNILETPLFIILTSLSSLSSLRFNSPDFSYKCYSFCTLPGLFCSSFHFLYMASKTLIRPECISYNFSFPSTV